MLEIGKGKLVVVAIDYFSRYIFAKFITTKEAKKIVDFLDEIYKKFKFKILHSDNGKELQNDLVEKWAKLHDVEQSFAIPYYHQSNGRVERANRTLRNGLRKTSGPIKKSLKNLIENYNNIKHRGIKMTPTEALDEKNWEAV